MQEITLPHLSFIWTSFRFARQLVRFCWKIFLQALLLCATAIGWFLVNMFSAEVIEGSIHDSEMRHAEDEAEREQQRRRSSYDQQYLNKPFHSKHH